jgi:hypothetical protein
VLPRSPDRQQKLDSESVFDAAQQKRSLEQPVTKTVRFRRFFRRRHHLDGRLPAGISLLAAFKTER